jgi:hypothetical protein
MNDIDIDTLKILTHLVTPGTLIQKRMKNQESQGASEVSFEKWMIE